MKKHWLRGMLLGVSLALLLAGGAALANVMTLTAEPYCFKCWPVEDDPIPGFFTTLTLTGHPLPSGVQPAVALEMCSEWLFEGQSVESGCEGTPPEEDPAVAYLLAWCPGDEPNPSWQFYLNTGPGFHSVLPWQYGVWTLKQWVQTANNSEASAREVVAGPASADFLVAEECEEVGFVPEPGSILLLGSGLVGLAGYATLRWRTRE